VDLSDVDLTSIAYGDEVVRALKAANVFLVPGENKYRLKYEFTETEKNLLASNIGKSALLNIVLEKGIIAGLKLYGLNSSISIDDIKYSSWDLTEEVYNIVTIVDQLNIDLENPLSMLELDEMQIALISGAISNSTIASSVIPVAISYVANHSEKLFGVPVLTYVDLNEFDYSIINWGYEIKALLTLGCALVSEENGDLVIALDITEDEFTNIESSFNTSKLIPQVIPSVQSHINDIISTDLLSLVDEYVDIASIDLATGLRWGTELVNILKVASGTISAIKLEFVVIVSIEFSITLTNNSLLLRLFLIVSTSSSVTSSSI
jgi:hypothetical protein